jgi:hypothetical protein
MHTELNTKVARIGEMLMQPNGVTRKELLKFSGWPTMSVPQQARANGLVVRRRKVGTTMRYFGSKAENAIAVPERLATNDKLDKKALRMMNQAQLYRLIRSMARSTLELLDLLEREGDLR